MKFNLTISLLDRLNVLADVDYRYDNLFVETDGTWLRLAAMDGGVAVYYWEVNGEEGHEQEGSAVVSLGGLKALAKLGGEAVLDDGDDYMRVKACGLTATLPTKKRAMGRDRLYYVEPPSNSWRSGKYVRPCIHLDARDLRDAINGVVYAADDEHPNVNVAGVAITARDNYISLQATDHSQMALRRLPIKPGSVGVIDLSAFTPVRALQHVVRLIDNSTATTVYVIQRQGYLLFRVGDGAVSAPDYNDLVVFPDVLAAVRVGDLSVTIDRRSLLAAVRTLAPAGRHSSGVVLQIHPDWSFVVSTPGGVVTSWLGAPNNHKIPSVTGEPPWVTVVVNGDWLARALEALHPRTHKVVVTVGSGDDYAVCIRPTPQNKPMDQADFVSIIMPIRAEPFFSSWYGAHGGRK